jgi:hypothetical protein
MTVISERFSSDEMSKQALGNEWLKRTEAEQQEFTFAVPSAPRQVLRQQD